MNQLMMPPELTGSLQEQLAKQYTYLFQMAQHLNLALEQWDAVAKIGQTAQHTAQAATVDIESVASGYDKLRSLIVKTADTVEREMDALRTELSGEYMAISDFGTYVEKLNAVIEADPTALTQYYRYFSHLQAAVDAVDADFNAYRTATEGYIKTGIVDYDGAVPVYGVAVGQDLETGVDANTGETVIEKKHFRAIFTARRLGFWEDGVEVAYVSDHRLYITRVEAMESLTVGQWRIGAAPAEDGLTIKWIGG